MNLFKVVLIGCVLIMPAVPAFALEVDRLSAEDIKQVEQLLERLTPLIKQRDAQENLATLTFPELYAPLSEEEQAFLKSFQDLDAKELGVKIPFRGLATGEEELVVIKGQKIKIKKMDEKTQAEQVEEKELPPQFLPKDVYEKYLEMMAAMEKDTGKRLYIESGYRSSAYQLYLFVFYLQNHDYSIRETVKFVALPGYSEHGAPAHQAIDFINAAGINGEDNPQEFADLAEFGWLQENANRFGFVLSYPKDAQEGITYEPWHWRYEQDSDRL